MNKITQTLATILLPFLPGYFLFFIIYGMSPLNVSNLDWFPNHNDPVQAWLGWVFFQHSPWNWPLGLNTSLGLELNNSIIFTDSNPLLAFFFKSFSFLLPPIFQYFGIWLLLCLFMQSFFGWKLTRLYTNNNLEAFLGSCLFTMSLPMLFRMSCHFNLAAHFLILAALYICLANEARNNVRQAILWAILLAAASMIHSYIFVMLSILWLADMGDRKITNSLSWKNAFCELTGVILLCSFTCWQSGYFIIGQDSSDGGFGLYRMNIWSIFDSDGFASYIVPDIPSFPGEGEGFAYLGMGGIFILISAIITLFCKKVRISQIIYRKWPLCMALLLLALLALSNKIGFALWEITIPIPKRVENYAQFFRASGRMFWPVYYMLIIFSLAVLVKYLTRRAAIIIMLFSLCLQTADIHALVTSQLAGDQNQTLAEMRSKLRDPFWEKATKYSKLRGYPIRGAVLPPWHVFGYFALQNGMGTDIVYLSRYNTEKLAKLEQETLAQILNGMLDPDSLYIVDDKTFALAKQSCKRAHLLHVDGFNVIAPLPFP